MVNPSVCVFYQCTPEGERALAFASDLAGLLGAEQLSVYLERSQAGAGLLALPASTSAHQVQSLRVTDRVARVPGFAHSRLEVRAFERSAMAAAFPPNSIVVDGRLAGQRSDVTVLVPFDETGLETRGKGPFVVPFGDGPSGLIAGRLAVALAARLDRQLVFYHSTWKNAAVRSADAADHMIPQAVDKRRALEKLAGDSGVGFQIVVETADDVVEGLIHCAMRVRANLIVMRRGLKTIIGSYVSQALEQSPVPILIAGADRERGVA
jgi:hypothetical protein